MVREVVKVDVVVEEFVIGIDYFDVVEFFFGYGFEYGYFVFNVLEV